MNSRTHGKTISELEVTNISSHGIWLFSNEEEFFLSYQDFPWFKEAPVGKILHVKEPSPGHYYWPDLDIDLEIETITTYLTDGRMISVHCNYSALLWFMPYQDNQQSC